MLPASSSPPPANFTAVARALLGKSLFLCKFFYGNCACCTFKAPRGRDKKLQNHCDRTGRQRRVGA